MNSLVEAIDDPGDPRVADYLSLTDVQLRRRFEQQHGLFIAEGERIIHRALEAGFRPHSFLTSARWLPSLRGAIENAGAPVYIASDSLLEQLTGFRVHRGALASMHRRPLPTFDDVTRHARRLAVLEAIVDHTNVGALFRSVAALGADGILIDPTCADPLYRRSVRVSMGAVFTVPWTRSSSWPADLQLLADRGFTTVALSPASEAVAIDTFAAGLGPDTKVALVLGTEGPGLSSGALAAVQHRVRIPMAVGIDSLNVAAAAAVAFYAVGAKAEILGQRASGGTMDS